MLSRFYFSDLFLYGKEITPYFMPRFILSGRKDSPAINYPFIYSCNRKREKEPRVFSL